MEERFLRGSPRFYDAHFLFNPWLSFRERIGQKRVKDSGKFLKMIEKIGGRVELIQQDIKKRNGFYLRQCSGFW